MPYISVKPDCLVDDCKREAYCRSYCERHYWRLRKYGDPLGSSGRYSAPRWTETDDPENSKICTKCKLRLPREAFQRNSKRSDGLQSSCKNCYRDWYNKHYAENQEFREKRSEYYKRDYEKNQAARREGRNARRFLRMYGITRDQFTEMSANQGGVCAICKRAPYADHPDPRKKRLSVDHDHATGKIRALLCDPCNTGLGMFQDNPDLLVAAAAYLRQHLYHAAILTSRNRKCQITCA